MASTVRRAYGIERSVGDIIYNPSTKTVFASIELGIFGRLTITLRKNQEHGYDILKPYKDREGNSQVVSLGKLFPAKDKNGDKVEGITRGSLALLREFDKELGKNVNRNNDALFITTHKLKEKKPLGESGLFKVGYIKGQLGIEIGDTNTNVSNDHNDHYESYDIDEDIPF